VRAHHHVAHLDLGDLQHALEHCQHVGVDQAAVAGIGQNLGELLQVAGLARQGFHQAPQPAARHPGTFFTHEFGRVTGR
jgi:hypothetical protein